MISGFEISTYRNKRPPTIINIFKLTVLLLSIAMNYKHMTQSLSGIFFQKNYFSEYKNHTYKV